MTAYFDENVFLAVVGGGFLRTPFAHSTQTMPDGVAEENDCASIDGEVIHIPAALRVNGLNMDSPPFRRVIFSADLIKRISTSEAVAYNQTEAGLTFGFNDAPNNSVARVVVDDLTKFQGESALFVDNIEPGFQPPLPTFMNNPEDRSRPTGFVVFVTRSWREERHVDPSVLMQHHLPLQFDQEFDGVPLFSNGFHLTLPVYGAKGKVTAWDMRMGPGEPGVIFDENGVIEVKYDIHGAPYLEIFGSGTPNDLLPIAIQDEHGQFFSRNLVLEGQLPSQSTIYLPTMRIGTPVNILVTLPEDYSVDLANSRLPRGLKYEDGYITGTPEEYGPYWRLVGVPTLQCGDGETCPQDAVVVFAINRPPCTLLTIGDGKVGTHGTTMGNDHHTGEYYAIQFVPYGLAITYGGWAYLAHRRFSSGFRYPLMKKIPWVYGRANRRSAVEQEVIWRTRCCYPKEVTLDDPAIYYRLRETGPSQPPKNFGWLDQSDATWRAIDSNDMEIQDDSYPLFQQPSLILNREDEGNEAMRFKWSIACTDPEGLPYTLQGDSRINLDSADEINGATSMTRTYEFWGVFEGNGTIWHQGNEMFGARIYRHKDRLIIGHWNYLLDDSEDLDPIDFSIWFWVDGLEDNVPYHIVVMYDTKLGAQVYVNGEQRLNITPESEGDPNWPGQWSSAHPAGTIGGTFDDSVECGPCSPQSSPIVSPSISPCPELCRSPEVPVPPIILPVSQCKYVDVVLATNPVYYYRMEEDDILVSTLFDETGENNGQIISALRGMGGLVQCSESNLAFGFQGIQGLVPANNNITQKSTYTERTVSLWFRPEGSGSLTGRQVLWEIGGGTRGFNIYLDNDTLYAGSWDTGLGRLNFTSMPGIQEGETYHVVWRWDGATGIMTLFVNGVIADVLVDPAMTSVDLHTDDGGIGFQNNNSRYHDNASGGGDTNYFWGIIDEVVMWNEALDDVVIEANYQSGIGNNIESGQSPINMGTGVALTRMMLDNDGEQNPSFSSQVLEKPTESIPGVFDEFALYTKRLDEHQITRHYEIGICRF